MLVEAIEAKKARAMQLAGLLGVTSLIYPTYALKQLDRVSKSACLTHNVLVRSYD